MLRFILSITLLTLQYLRPLLLSICILLSLHSLIQGFLFLLLAKFIIKIVKDLQQPDLKFFNSLLEWVMMSNIINRDQACHFTFILSNYHLSNFILCDVITQSKGFSWWIWVDPSNRHYWLRTDLWTLRLQSRNALSLRKAMMSKLLTMILTESVLI